MPAQPAAGQCGAHLAVDTQQPAHLGDQVGQRMAEMAAQHTQLVGQRDDAPVPFGRIANGWARIGERVGQARGIGPRPGRLGDLLGCFGGARRMSTVEGDRAPPQRGDVAGAKPPPRPGEHPHGGRPGCRVGDQAQHRDHVGHLGHREQPGQSDHFHRDAAGAQRVGDRCRIGVAAQQNRRGRRRDTVGGRLLVAQLQ